jgi:hypothetical protein
VWSWFLLSGFGVVDAGAVVLDNQAVCGLLRALKTLGGLVYLPGNKRLIGKPVITAMRWATGALTPRPCTTWLTVVSLMPSVLAMVLKFSFFFADGRFDVFGVHGWLPFF